MTSQGGEAEKPREPANPRSTARQSTTRAVPVMLVCAVVFLLELWRHDWGPQGWMSAAIWTLNTFGLVTSGLVGMRIAVGGTRLLVLMQGMCLLAAYLVLFVVAEGVSQNRTRQSVFPQTTLLINCIVYGIACTALALLIARFERRRMAPANTIPERRFKDDDPSHL